MSLEAKLIDLGHVIIYDDEDPTAPTLEAILYDTGWQPIRYGNARIRPDDGYILTAAQHAAIQTAEARLGI